jgi:hypothetical protein
VAFALTESKLEVVGDTQRDSLLKDVQRAVKEGFR